MVKVLAIETSCDETSVAVVKNRRILSNILATQVKYHAKYGGGVPDLARRKHKEFLPSVLKRALQVSGATLSDIDVIAVTVGPGLAIALEVGIAKAKELAKRLNKPLVAVNHMEGHLLAVLAKNRVGKGGYDEKKYLPWLGVLISGGHTELVLVEEVGRYRIIGETLDDAAGEAFDKIGRMLGLGYPAGPVIEQLAKKGRDRFVLPVPMKGSGDLNFSFSGLKTAVLYAIKDYVCRSGRVCGLKEVASGQVELDKEFVQDMAFSFQKTVGLALEQKIKSALKKYNFVKAVSIGGGVGSNLYIRSVIRKTARSFGLPLLLPYSKKLYSDNAGMIGVAGYLKYCRGEVVADVDELDRQPSLRVEEVSSKFKVKS
ncbi:MAG: tRNA (adenosine(37)-N6)-threonylcarbamoyltransferase complex transferase subunit TsaD [bacterium]|nr:tRNA (adenosine(37)-N6)-threonylcarbamoyltransferase complex transferase subunit TsaD [bacterium]